MRSPSTLLTAIAFAGLSACSSPPALPDSTSPRRQAGVDPQLAARLRQYAPAEMTAALSGMPDNERQALARMVEASQLFDGLFLEQVWADNASMRVRLASDDTPQGVSLQVNDLFDRGAFVVNADGTFALAGAKIREAVVGLTHDLMTIEAEGKYDAAKELLARAMVIRPEVQRVLDRLKDVPVDIEPIFRPIT